MVDFFFGQCAGGEGHSSMPSPPPFSIHHWFRTKWNSVWCQFNRECVITIEICFQLPRFGKDFSVRRIFFIFFAEIVCAEFASAFIAGGTELKEKNLHKKSQIIKAPLQLIRILFMSSKNDFAFKPDGTCSLRREFYFYFLSNWKECIHSDNFLLIMNQTELRSVHNLEKNCH